MASQREIKIFRLEVKDLSDTGQFTGYASVYGIVDQMGDIVEPGAFTKTIQEHGSEIPILWQHNSDEPIGIGTLSDSEHGLIISGKLELELLEGQKAYIRLKRGLAKGLSIGYRTITEAMEKGKRLLKEIKLYEVSIVVFPANELALVTSVKSEPEDSSPDQQFEKALSIVTEQKAGRTISAASRSKIEQAITVLMALIAEPDDTNTPDEDEGAGKCVSDGPPKQDSDVPDELHAALEQFKSNLRRII
jgi:hypothetical protein